jgi:hypothetical protein
MEISGPTSQRTLRNLYNIESSAKNSTKNFLSIFPAKLT